MKVSIIGSGTMAQQIAALMSSSEAVKNIEVFSTRFSNEKAEIEFYENINVLQDKYRKTCIDVSKISTSHHLKSAVSCAEIIFESTKEDFNVKKKILKELSLYTNSGQVVCSNTSSLRIRELCNAYKYKHNFYGVHFFNPALTIKVVEFVILAKKNTSDGVKSIRHLFENLEKKLIIVPDQPGFLVNKLLLILINESSNMLTSELDVKEIDYAYKNITQSLSGPFEIADLIGLDVVKEILENLYKDTKNEIYFPSKKIMDLCENNDLGKKTGKGFYNYST